MNSIVQVDDRIGSKEMAPLLDYVLPTPTKVTRLQSGDFMFAAPKGGPGDELALVGIERKRIRDMIQSIMSGRLAGSQLPLMAQQYDFTFLIVEGEYRCNSQTGKLEILNSKRRWQNTIWKRQALDYRSLDAAMNTLRLKTPVQVIKTYSPQHTAMEIFHLWHWFNSKSWSKHKSYVAFPEHANPNVMETFTKASDFRRIVKELPHIGWTRSQAVEDLFNGKLDSALKADVNTWALIDGITVKRALDIVKVLRKMTKG